MSTPSKRMVRIDAEVAQYLKVVAARRQTTTQALVELALLQWCRRQPEYREAKKVG